MQNSTDPYKGLPTYPTIGEIIAKVGEVAAENLAKITPPQSSEPKPETAE
jgi:hypothetical protein